MGLEEGIPISLRKSIPRTTLHRWRQEKDNKYLGCELNNLAKSELELLKEFARSKKAKRIFITYVRIGRFIQELASDKFMRAKFKQNKEDVIDIVERARTSMPFEHVLKCFGLSKTTYNTWVMGLYSNCNNSKLDWCLIRQPQQMDAKELETMESLLTSKEYAHWPISSIAHYARRNGLIYASHSTWYKYAKLLKVKREKIKKKEYKKRTGIKASRPNEIWHADVSYFKIGVQTYYIYFLVDNYSRKILSHLVSNSLSAALRLQTIQTAYENEIGVDPEELILMVDGGSENNNHLVNDYVSKQPHLKKIRALHDIRFGNTQVESHFRILKYNWLYRKEIINFSQLRKELDDYVQDFNDERPAHVLDGMTPSEVYFQHDNYFDAHCEKQQHLARKNRYIVNKCNACSSCQLAHVQRRLN